MAIERTRRKTVGVLVGFQIYNGSYPNPFAFPIIRGMQAAAWRKNVNLLIACGISRIDYGFRSAWPELGEEMDFVPVGPWNTDGLIIMGPLRSKSRIDYGRRLVDEGFPVLFVGADAGSPAIFVDNEGGIQQAMEHLIQHHHRNIAFIAGDETDNGDSVARLAAYRKGVQEFGLNDDPRLVEYGQHWNVGGYNAVRRLLSSGVKFTAVMCSNDQSALGAMSALQEEGRRIPLDVAITGFDDIKECLAHFPPLTTVHYPLFETGYRALLLLLQRIEHGPGALPEETRVSTTLVARQSCGCLLQLVSGIADRADSSGRDENTSPQNIREGLAQSMQEQLLMESYQADDSELGLFCGRLVDSLMMSLDTGNQSHFQNTLIDILLREETKDEDNIHAWQSVVSVLRQGVHAILKGDRDPLRAGLAEDLLHQARTILNDSSQRRHMRVLAQQTEGDESMGLLTSRLMASSDEDQIFAAFREYMPLVGVNGCNIIFFEPQGEDPVAVSRLHPLEKDAPVLRFSSRQFPPQYLYPEGKPLNLALLPLTFHEEKLGYVVFDGGNLNPLAVLVRLLSFSLKNFQLRAKVADLSLADGLTGLHNRRYFEILLERETERSRRYDRPLAVVMIEIDGFREYSDSFGPNAGNEALQRAANGILDNARRGLDVVARYGRERFAVILPETDVDGAREVAGRIHSAIAADRRFLRQVTASLGISAISKGQAHAAVLIDQAERALNQAVSQGRNRAVLYEDWMMESAYSYSPGK